MINTQYVGRKIKLPQQFKDYAQEKIDSLEKFVKVSAKTLNAEVEVEKSTHHRKGNSMKCQLTLWIEGSPLRAENEGDDLNEIFDLAFDRIKRLAEKHEIKNHQYTHKTVGKVAPKKSGQIIRRKKLTDLKPMNEAQAINQIEALGHDFLIFLDEDGTPNVLYKRRGGGYGIIEF